MPRKSQHAIAWCRDSGTYELATAGNVARHFRPEDEAVWRSWLGTATDFTFRGASGDLGVYHEAHPRGGRYWYAYRAGTGRGRKCYLGPTARVTLARLEEAARTLAGGAAPGSAGAFPAPIPATAPADDPADALPATKLAPPPRARLVDRGRLLDSLDATATVPLTLVAAPAGWGKTTLLAAWAARHPARVAWLALEEADDSPSRFWAAAIAALRARLPGVGATALALLRAPRPPPLAVVVTALVNDLAERTTIVTPLALVLDDYQTIADPAVTESVAYLLAHLPAGLRLIVASWHDPDLPLARLRARGQLAELRAADLGFTADEIGAFMGGALDTPLTADEAAALAARTEGWAAGVQLAALALIRYDDRAAWLVGFTGGHRYLLDYVEEEVLAWQPPAMRQFLLQIAVLTRLSAAACEAVTGEAASAAILAALERANLFLIPLDEGRQWYRLHDLFREALLARAMREPGLLPGAHRRAARWHAEFGDVREAIAHTQAAGDHTFVAELIARAAPALWLAGEAAAVLGWFLDLPDDTLASRAPLALDAALRRLEAAQLAEESAYAVARVQVERLLARIEDAAPSEPGAPGADGVTTGRRIRLLRAMLAARSLLARQDATGLGRLVDEIAGLAEGEATRWRLIPLALDFWHTFWLGGDGATLLRALASAKQDALAGGDHLAALRTMAWLDTMYTQAGWFEEAEREGEEGLALAARRGLHYHLVGTLHANRAARLALQDRLAEAGDAARATLAVGREWQLTNMLSDAHRMLAYLALAEGDPSASARELAQAEEALQRGQTTVDRALVEAGRARCWLVAGDLVRAQAWSEGATEVGRQIRLFERAVVVEMRARVALAGGHHDAALAALAPITPEVERAGDYFRLTVSLALRFVALHHAERADEARAVAIRLLALTAPNDALRAYLDEGPPMARALIALGDLPDAAPVFAASSRAHLARILAAFTSERREGRKRAASSRHSAVPMLAEPLTRREREVLRLLADGATNQEIAAATAVALATAKKHVGNLLGKLGATNRTGAVARARELGLV